MFCPKCKAEYRAGFEKCMDCDVELIKTLPVESDNKDHHSDRLELVTVLVTVDQGKLALAKSILQEAGIPFITMNEGYVPWGTLWTPQLQVSESDSETALQLLKDLKDEAEPE